MGIKSSIELYKDKTNVFQGSRKQFYFIELEWFKKYFFIFSEDKIKCNYLESERDDFKNAFKREKTCKGDV